MCHRRKWRLAARSASTSAWAVGSPEASRRLWPRAITSPSATMTQPTGTSPAAPASSPRAMASRMKRSSASSSCSVISGMVSGSGRIRTSTPLFRRQVLYPLSHGSIEKLIYINDLDSSRRSGSKRFYGQRRRWDSNPWWGCPHANLANWYLRPLGHPSLKHSVLRKYLKSFSQSFSLLPVETIRLSKCRLAEEEGFEPPELSFGGFQDRCLRPLGHSSFGTGPGV